MFATPARLLTAVVAWPVHSQQTSRRNALVAGTALAARRRELLEVEEFLAERTRRGLDARAPADLREAGRRA